jgi:hypothetical protein
MTMLLVMAEQRLASSGVDLALTWEEVVEVPNREDGMDCEERVQFRWHICSYLLILISILSV